MKGFSVKIDFNVEISFFDYPLTLEINSLSTARAGFGNMSFSGETQTIFYKDSKPILAYLSLSGSDAKASSGSRFLAEQGEIQTDPGLISCLSVTLALLQEVNRDLSSRRRSSSLVGGSVGSATHFNNNGTVDNNHNSFDNF